MQLKFELFEDEFGVSSPQVAAAVEALAQQEGTETRGAIFTRPEVVDFILDLAGYTVDQPLHRKRLLDPFIGGGDFLLFVTDGCSLQGQGTGRQQGANYKDALEQKKYGKK